MTNSDDLDNIPYCSSELEAIAFLEEQIEILTYLNSVMHWQFSSYNNGAINAYKKCIVLLTRMNEAIELERDDNPNNNPEHF